MIIAGFLGQNTAPAAAAAAASSVTPAALPAPATAITPPIAPSVATRDPFTRPAAARRGFSPTTPHTYFVPEFEALAPTIARPMGPGLPIGVRNPPRSDPSFELPKADPSGQSSVPASVPSPVKMSARAMPPGLVMALGIMPPVRGIRGSRVNPNALVVAGRKPTDVG